MVACIAVSLPRHCVAFEFRFDFSWELKTLVNSLQILLDSVAYFAASPVSAPFAVVVVVLLLFHLLSLCLLVYFFIRFLQVLLLSQLIRLLWLTHWLTYAISFCSLSLSFAHSTLILSHAHSITQLKLSRPARHSRPAPLSVDPWQSASSAVASASDNDLLWLPRRRSSDAVATRATHVKHSLKGQKKGKSV